MVHIITLMDDKPTEHLALIAEHGLSCYVEKDGYRFLFDCGAGPAAPENARRLYTGPRFIEEKYAVSGARRTMLSAGFGEAFVRERGISRRTVEDVEEIAPGPFAHIKYRGVTNEADIEKRRGSDHLRQPEGGPAGQGGAAGAGGI